MNLCSNQNFSLQFVRLFFLLSCSIIFLTQCGPLPCDSNKDCSFNRICDHKRNICRIGCSNDKDCQEKEICNVKIQTCRSGCHSDEECSISDYCELTQQKCLPLKSDCTGEMQRACYNAKLSTLGKGICKSGLKNCTQHKTWSLCTGQVIPQKEVCGDKKDNNCNGKTDEGCAPIKTCLQLSQATKLSWQVKRLKKQAHTLQVTIQIPKSSSFNWPQAPNVQTFPKGWTQKTLFEANRPTLLQLELSSQIKWTQDLELEISGDIQLQKENKRCENIVWTHKISFPNCESGQTDCKGLCIVLNTDKKNCGSCGQVCQVNESCCKGQCIDLKGSSLHCGICGSSCALSQNCCGGSCKKIKDNPTHCGACGRSCKPNQSCCGNDCHDLQNDTKHCGACGNSCGKEQACCKGSCIDLNADPKNCGYCGQICSSKTSCCNGQCIDTSTSKAHCSKCSNICKGSCRESICHICKSSRDCPTGKLCRLKTCIKCPGDPNCDKILHLTSGDAGVYDYHVNSKGEIYLTGDFWPNAVIGSKTESKTKGKNDIYIAKLDPKGKSIWTHLIGSLGTDSWPKLKLDQKENIYLSGCASERLKTNKTYILYNTVNPTILTHAKNSTNNIFFAKFSSQGKLSWVTQVSAEGSHSWNQTFELSPSGESWLTFALTKTKENKGVFCNSKNMYNGKDPLDSEAQMILIRLDSKGKCLSSRIAGATDNKTAAPKRIVLTKNKDSYIFGEFAYWGDTRLKKFIFGTHKVSFFEQNDWFITKLDPKGKFLWARSFGGKWRDQPGGLAIDGKENLYLSGNYSDGFYTQTDILRASSLDALLMKLDSNGKKIWTLECKGKGENHFPEVFYHKDHLYAVLTGTKYKISCRSLTIPSKGEKEHHLLKIDAKTGNVLWFSSFTGQLSRVTFQTSGTISLLMFSHGSKAIFLDGKQLKQHSNGWSSSLWSLRP